MIVIHKYKCAYKLIPRCGSQTVCAYFGDLIGVKPGKWSDGGFKAIGTRVRWELEFSETPEDYYSFSFVRNPWSRFASCYYEFLKYLKATRAGTPGAARQNKKWVDEGKLTISQMIELMPSKEDPPTFDTFTNFVVNIEREHGKPNGHWSPSQYGKLCDDDLGVSDYDFIGRLETFEKDFKHVLNTVGAPINDIPWEHKQLAKSNKTYKDFYTNQKLIDDIGKYYQEDVDEFKFTFEK